MGLDCPTCDDFKCSQTACQESCKLNNQGYLNSCNIDPSIREIVMVDDYCLNFCLNNNFQVYHCKGDDGSQVPCSADVCYVRECTDTLIQQGYIADTVCADNNMFYENKVKFCKEKMSNNEDLKFVLCDSEACKDEESCYNQNCLVKHQSYVPTCDHTEFEFHDTVEGWCRAKAEDQSKQFCMSGPDFCPFEFCFKEKCKHENAIFSGGCDTSDDVWTPLGDVILFCETKWQDFENQVDHTHKCVGACDCKVEQCAMKIGEQPVCSSTNNVFYDTSKAYCVDVVQSQMELEIQDCGDKCENREHCCEANCRSEIFFPACLAPSHEFFDNEDEYCKAKCALDPLNDQHNMCTFSDPLCPENCCAARCMQAPYQHRCSADYKLMLDHTQFCT